MEVPDKQHKAQLHFRPAVVNLTAENPDNTNTNSLLQLGSGTELCFQSFLLSAFFFFFFETAEDAQDLATPI